MSPPSCLPDFNELAELEFGSDDDDHSSSSESTDTRRSSSTDNDSVATLLATKETLIVNRAKLLVYLVLALAAAGVGYVTHYFLSEEEKGDFEVQVRCCIVVLA
jgi:hypothetical protein